MRITKRWILELGLALALVAVAVVSCAEPQSVIERKSAALDLEPVYKITNYVERANINRRLKLFDNRSQVSWIYCLGDNGQVVFYGPVLGKVTSSGKRLEPNSTAGCDSGLTGICATDFDGQWTTERMQADGTFGASDNYIFWFDTAHNYYQWDGKYFLTSVPIKIKESVLNVRDVSEDKEK